MRNTRRWRLSKGSMPHLHTHIIGIEVVVGGIPLLTYRRLVFIIVVV